MADGFDEAIYRYRVPMRSVPLVVYDAERCIDILVGLGVDEAELRKHPESATSEESVEA